MYKGGRVYAVDGMEHCSVINTHVQLSLGQEKLKRLKDTKDNKELEEVQAEIQRLQNELKVRMKLNQLQSTKVTYK